MRERQVAQRPGFREFCLRSCTRAIFAPIRMIQRRWGISSSNLRPQFFVEWKVVSDVRDCYLSTLATDATASILVLISVSATHSLEATSVFAPRSRFRLGGLCWYWKPLPSELCILKKVHKHISLPKTQEDEIWLSESSTVCSEL
jgi:hypothetical protein